MGWLGSGVTSWECGRVSEATISFPCGAEERGGNGENGMHSGNG